MIGLALVVPAILAAGLLARRPLPQTEAFPGGPEDLASTRATRAVTSLDDGGRISVALYELEASPSGLAVALSIDVDRGRPEWLAYWAPGEETAGGRLPDEAWLLGALTDNEPARFPLPEPAAETRGRIVVYRLIDHEVVAQLRLPERHGGSKTLP